MMLTCLLGVVIIIVDDELTQGHVQQMCELINNKLFSSIESCTLKKAALLKCWLRPFGTASILQVLN